MNTRLIGNQVEAAVARYLTKRGYQMVTHNYRCKAGEIDLIALHQGYLVFIEVKYRSKGTSGSPEAAVNAVKQRRISRAALWYLTEAGIAEEQPCRFDVVGVTPKGIKLHQHAFEWRR